MFKASSFRNFFFLPLRQQTHESPEHLLFLRILVLQKSPFLHSPPAFEQLSLVPHVAAASIERRLLLPEI